MPVQLLRSRGWAVVSVALGFLSAWIGFGVTLSLKLDATGIAVVILSRTVTLGGIAAGVGGAARYAVLSLRPGFQDRRGLSVILLALLGVLYVIAAALGADAL